MGRSSLSAELARISQHQERLPGPIAVILGVVALGAVALPDIWLLARHLNTIVHEAAHATMGSLLGRRVHGITMSRHGTGATMVPGGKKIGSAAVLAIGYLGPSAFGLAAAKLIQLGHMVAVLWLAMGMLVCLLAVVRRSFGVLTVLGTEAGLFVVALYASVGAQVMAAYVIAWFLLLSGVLVIRSHGRKASDAAELRKLTSIPPGFWSFLWLTGSVGALGFGTTLLV